MGDNTVPTWDGDPTTFETFSTASRWYERSLKETERKLAASRIWQKLTGAAKSVVRHLDPGDFDDQNGLTKLLNVLRESPLQKLPVPDSFSRLERWSQLRRGPHETIPQLLVREEDLFVELQQALKRARAERVAPTRSSATSTSRSERPPSQSPSASPTAAPGATANEEDHEVPVFVEPAPSTTTGFFEDELRGYRLLKASKLTMTERQHVLTLTKNATHFELIRRALRTLFSEEDTAAHMSRGQRNVWYAGDDWEQDAYFASYGDGETEVYFEDWSPSNEQWDDGWNDSYEAYWYGNYEDWNEDDGASSVPQSVDEMASMDGVPEDLRSQFNEAYALSQEANKTLAQAKAAVAKVRASRGYYDPASSSGKGMSPSSKGSGGPCIICGKPDHHTSRCPDRFSGSPSSSKGKGYGKPKGKGSFGKKGKGKSFGKKGKFKSKGKGKGIHYNLDYEYAGDAYNYFISFPNLDVYVLSLENQEVSWSAPQKALVDTGATENVAGVASMSRLIDTGLFEYRVEMGDRPTFRFGDGLSLKATSRVDLVTPALGVLKVYVLDGTGEQTPLLLGARDLHERRANIDYDTLFMCWSDDLNRDWGCDLIRLNSGHLSVELSKKPKRYHRARPPSSMYGIEEDDDGGGGGDDDGEGGDHGGRKKLRRRFEPNDESKKQKQHPLRPPHRQSESPSEPAYSPSPSKHGSVKEKEKTDDEMFGIPEEDPTPAEELEDLVGMCGSDAVEKDCAVEPTADSPAVPSFPSAECDVEPLPAPETSPSPQQLHDVSEDDQHVVHMVGMVSKSEATGCEIGMDAVGNVRGRLDRLARRLQAFEDDFAWHPDSSSSGVGPETRRVAMLGQALGEAKVEPACQLESMCAVRSTHQLCGEAWACGCSSQCWSRSPDSGDGPAGIADDVHRGPGEREGDAGQDHGSPRKDYGGYRKWPSEHPSQSLTADGKGFDGDGQATGSAYVCSNDYGGTQDDLGSPYTIGSRSYTHVGDESGCIQPRGGDDGWIMAAAERRLGQPDCSAEERIRRSTAEGEASSQAEGSGLAGGLRSQMASVWQSLQKLRSGMRSTWDCRNQHDSHDTAADTTNSTTTLVTTSEAKDTNDTTIPVATSATGPRCDGPSSEGHELPERDDLGRFLRDRGSSRTLTPHVAKKLAIGAALIGSAILQPVNEMFQSMSPQVDVMEIACSPYSSLTSAFEDSGYRCQRINYKNGYDLDKRAGTQKLRGTLDLQRPKLSWISLPCTRLTSLQNLTPRTELQWIAFRKRQQQDLKRADEVAEGLEGPISRGDDFAWEWPFGAHDGWKSKAIRRLRRCMEKYGRRLYWCRFDGCAYGLKYEGTPVLKRWMVATSSRSLWLHLCRRCQNDHDHRECRGPVAQASSYYPKAMVSCVVKAFKEQWSHPCGSEAPLEEDVQCYLLEGSTMDPSEKIQPQPTSTTPQILALSRQRFPSELPTGKKLEQMKQQMLRVHRAAGHASFQNLQRLLRARGAPDWAVTLAGSLQCKECQEARRPRPHPPASSGEEPRLFEVLGTDVFDYIHEENSIEHKYKFIIWKDRASGLTMVDLLKQFGGGTGISDWQPSTEDIVKSYSRWAMTNPPPQWILADSATYFTSNAMLDFVSRSGIGLTISPAEAHWIMGSEESAIRLLKYTVDRLKKEHSMLDIPSLFQLAAGAHNSSIGPSGYSPFQWTRGGDSHQLPEGLDANKAFGGMLKLKDQARLAFEKEKAHMKYSKLNNSSTRRPMVFSVGDLLMLWRQRPRPGKMAGSWVGPVRLLLQEGTTLWLATGSTLIRAKTNQVRQCSKSETMTASLEGTAIYSSPVTLDTLLKDFSGRNFWDISNEVPSAARQEANLQPTEVAAEPDLRHQPDAWRLEDGGTTRLLVRVHNLPRMNLFSPEKVASCPIPSEEFTGKRTTFVNPIHGGEGVIIHDDGEPKTLTYRWTGETHFELLSRKTRRKAYNQPQPQDVPPQQPAEPQPSILPSQEPSTELQEQPPTQPRKRQLDGEVDQGDVPLEKMQRSEEQQDSEGRELPSEPPDLQQVLQERGPNVLDGLPKELQRPVPHQGASGSNNCAIPGCVLPGGHEGSHKNTQGDLFLWDPYHGRQWITEDKKDDDGSSDSSSISEELVPDAPDEALHLTAVPEEELQGVFYAFEMDVTSAELEKLSKFGSHRSSIWLSKKMQEKSKEHSWTQLSLDRKKDFDVAQAKELSNVMASKALRSLTSSELRNLDHKKVMGMRWVLTTKSSGLAKARLVVLGFQAPNITEVETASPTLSKLSKHMLLSLAANLGYRIKSGDITSAFLQAKANLESDELTVWAPPELAVLYGAPADRPILPLRIVRAFYGLVQSPRLWFEDLQATMLKQGWKQITADRCAFILLHDGELVGLAGVHVDDYLIAGKQGDVVFEQAEKSLRDAYNFGKWEADNFEFAGTYLQQDPDGTIHLDQHDYVTKWLDEIDLDKGRMSQKKSPLTPSEVSSVRAALGTLSWRATQSAPQFLADVSLLLSEVGRSTIETIDKVNKLVREVKRTSRQRLSFHPWRVPLQDLVIVVWADASNHNRPDRSSTMGLIAGMAPRSILSGSEEAISILQWKSSKTPRQCLGSNGAEVQAITIGEDLVFHLRALLAEFRGIALHRYSLHKTIRDTTEGALVMDSRGIFDAATRNLSSLHGLRESRAGYELTLAVNQAKLTGTHLRWVNGLAQLGDSLTKWQARKAILQFFARGQRWMLVDDPMFVAGKKCLQIKSLSVSQISSW